MSRHAAERDQHAVGLDRRPVLRRDRDDGVALLDPGGVLAHDDLDAVALERLGDLHAGELLLAGEQPALALDQRDLRAERLEGLRHLGADHAAAEDREPVRDRLDRGGVAVGPQILDVVHARDVGDLRVRAAGEEDGAPGLELLGPAGVQRDLDAPLAGQPAAPAHELDALVLEPREHPGVVEPMDDLVAPVEDRLDVQAAGDGLGGALDTAGLGERLVRPQQGLRGHAGPERALAADEAVLHDGHLQPARGEPSGGHLAGRAGAEHHNVECPHEFLRHRFHGLLLPYNGPTHPGDDMASTWSVSWGRLRVEVPGGLVKPRETNKCEVSRLHARRLAETR